MPSPPTRPGAPEPDPQDTIGSAQTRLRPGPSEHFELVAQGQILEDEVVAETTGTNEDAHEQIQEAHHRRGRISAGFSSHRKLIENRAGDRVSAIRIDFCRPTASYLSYRRVGEPHCQLGTAGRFRQETVGRTPTSSGRAHLHAVELGALSDSGSGRPTRTTSAVKRPVPAHARVLPFPPINAFSHRNAHCPT